MTLDNAIHEALNALNGVRWRDTAFHGLQWYYAEGGLYVFRCKHGEPDEHLCAIRAKSADEAIARVNEIEGVARVKTVAQNATVSGGMAALRKTLEEMATDLEDLANRDGMRAPAYSSIFSIYAEKCRKALAAPPKNCDRFNNADEAVEYYADEGLKEAWKELKERIVEGKKYEFAMDFVFMIEWLFAKAKGVNDGSK